jgi:hypothetical protein
VGDSPIQARGRLLVERAADPDNTEEIGEIQLYIPLLARMKRARRVRA